MWLVRRVLGKANTRSGFAQENGINVYTVIKRITENDERISGLDEIVTTQEVNGVANALLGISFFKWEHNRVNATCGDQRAGDVEIGREGKDGCELGPG